jgi:hypothetical protein
LNLVSLNYPLTDPPIQQPTTNLPTKPINKLAFPTGRDSASFWDKGTEVPSLPQDKGTTGQAQNLATGWDGTKFFTGCPVLSRDRGVCPASFAPALVQGQRDTGTRKFFCSGTKGQRDVPSRGNATTNPSTDPPTHQQNNQPIN